MPLDPQKTIFRQRPGARRAFCAMLLAAAACASPAAQGPQQKQSHEKSADGYTLRSSVAATASLPASSLADQGIEPAPHRALLNVVVLKSGQKPRRTVPAEVEAHVRTLSGSRRAIEMKEVKANDRVSYVGVVDHAAREVLNFEIRARPEGTQKAIVLRYQDRMAP